MISKPHIWDRGTRTVSFENQPTPQADGGREDRNPTYFSAGAASTPDASAPSVYATREAVDIKE
jgi:hypothetical protein